MLDVVQERISDGPLVAPGKGQQWQAEARIREHDYLQAVRGVSRVERFVARFAPLSQHAFQDYNGHWRDLPALPHRELLRQGGPPTAGRNDQPWANLPGRHFVRFARYVV